LNKSKHYNDDHYRLTYLPTRKIRPSPENETLYGPIDVVSTEFDELCKTIEDRGLDEPIIVTSDFYILSGHRRYAACSSSEKIPCWIRADIRREGHPD
jgi:ParB-like chromosome segregation protein Spo0J